MVIMVSGPYTSGSDDPVVWEKNLWEMNEAAYEVFKKGHTPLIGVNAALPIIKALGEDKYDEIMMPISLALADKCDAVLRIGGPSKGADEEVEIFIKKGQPVYYDINEVP
jgi:hypothetical protein